MPPATEFLRGPLRPQEFRQPGPPLPSPTFVPSYFIIGITWDETGAILGGVQVKLFRTADDVLLQTAYSDAGTGQYAFALDNLTQCYVAAFSGDFGRALFGVRVYGLSDSGQVAGITNNNLVAV